MENTARFGVSMSEGLLDRFDRLIEEKGYGNRSEAVRDLIRGKLVEEEWRGRGSVVGTLTLVYDHDSSDLVRRLTEIQHGHHAEIISTLHVHLDHHNCLEVLVLKGRARQVRALADRLISTKDVKHGRLTMTTSGKGMR